MTNSYFDEDTGDFIIENQGKKVIIKKSTYEHMDPEQIINMTLPDKMKDFPVDTWIIDEDMPDDKVILDHKKLIPFRGPTRT